jgi:hypothetical protein
MYSFKASNPLRMICHHVIFPPFATETGEATQDQGNFGVGEPPKEPLALAAGHDEACLCKQSQMPGNYGGIQSKHSRKFTATALALSEDREDPHPRLMGKGLAQSHQILGNLCYCIVGHKCKITRLPGAQQVSAGSHKNSQNQS